MKRNTSATTNGLRSLEQFSKVITNCEERFPEISLRAGGSLSTKSTGSARQGRRAYRFFEMRLPKNVTTFENHFKYESLKI
jgi:hypothetical protein